MYQEIIHHHSSDQDHNTFFTAENNQSYMYSEPKLHNNTLIMDFCVFPKKSFFLVEQDESIQER